MAAGHAKTAELKWICTVPAGNVASGGVVNGKTGKRATKKPAIARGLSH